MAARRTSQSKRRSAAGRDDGGAGGYVAILRGINVGGKNRLPMKDLVRLFEAAGAKDVKTYIQSGNVAFRARASRVRAIASAVTAGLARELELEVPIILRSARELAAVVARNPFLGSEAPHDRLHVVFLDREPTAAEVSTLDPARSSPDVFIVRGREIYLFCPNGVGRSKLTNAYFDRKLSAVSSARNWRTVETLLTMVRD